MPPTGSEAYQDVRIAARLRDLSAGTSISLVAPESFKPRMRLNAPMTWTLDLDNGDGDYLPGTLYEDWLRYKANRVLEVDVMSLGQTDSFERLVPLYFGFTSDVSSGRGVRISGTDWSWQLLDENQSMDDWRSSTGDVKTSNGIGGEILAEYGVTGSLSFWDYVIRLFRFQGEIPLDKLKKLLRPAWGRWWMDGATFVAEDPPGAASPPADWTIVDTETIVKLERACQAANVITRVKVRRIEEGSADPLRWEGMDVGFHDEPTDFPCIVSGAVYEAQYGEINQIYLYDADSNIEPLGISPPGPVVGVTWVFQQNGGLTAEEAANLYGRLTIKGRRAVDDVGLEDVSGYAVEVINDTVEALFGEQVPGAQPIYDELLADEGAAVEHGERTLAESARQYEQISGTFGLFLGMRPGQTMDVEEQGSGTGGLWDLEDVDMDVSIRSPSLTTIRATKRRSDSFSWTAE